MRACGTCGAELAGDARFCPGCGAPVAEGLAEERKVVTILFADVLGSTELGERLDPERLRVVLRSYFAAMAAVIDSWGGTVEKYIGDAIMAVFGAPTTREDDPERALRAAQEMLVRLDELNAGFEQEHNVNLRVRIGVNTGEVIAPMGARAAGQFLVSGDAVNVAARLETAADPSTVLVGERTYLAARHSFSFGPPIELQLKGKSEPVRGWSLGAALPEPARGFEIAVPMIGRERELNTLLGLLDEAVESEQPRAVLVLGPAGIGKSRMLREFAATAAERHPDLTLYRGRCLSAGHGITFWALGEVLRTACGISLDEAAESARDSLHREMARILEPLHLPQQEADETIGALAASAGITLPESPLADLEPDRVADEIARAWPRFLTGLAAAAPTIVALEDLHWADEQMLSLVERLAARSDGRLLLVATARPELTDSSPSLVTADDLTTISLRPLNANQSQQMVDALLSQTLLPDTLHAQIVERADGNPFFLEEIVQRLVDDGALARDGAGWRATGRAAVVDLPDSIHALLAARIDALPPDEKRVLHEASVVGRIFWAGPVARALPDIEVERLLGALERRGLVLVRPTSSFTHQTEYTFRHALIRDVAYASLPKARRARAHAELAAWMEELAGDRRDEFGELIAHHYRTSVVGEDADLAWAGSTDERDETRRRAVAALLMAGDSARHRFAVSRAIDLHEQALHLCQTDAERVDAHEALGDDHETLFHGDEAIDAYRAAVKAARTAPEPSVVIPRLAAKVALMAQRYGAFRELPAGAEIEAIVDEGLREATDDAVRARLLAARASMPRVWIGARRGRGSGSRPADPVPLDERLADATRAAELAEQLDLPDVAYLAADAFVQLHWLRGNFAAYQDAIAREVALTPRLSSDRQRMDILFTAAVAQSELGAFEDAMRSAEQALAIGAHLSPHEMMHASCATMEAAFYLGRWDRVLELFPRHLEAAAGEPDVPCGLVRGGPVLGAMVLVARGEAAAARRQVPPEQLHRDDTFALTPLLTMRYEMELGMSEHLSSATDELAGSDDPVALSEAAGVVAEAMAHLGAWDELRTFLGRVRSLEIPSAIVRPMIDRAEARLRVEEGDPDAAHKLLAAAIAAFDRLKAPFEASRTREALAALRPAEARSLLQAALAAYEGLGAAPHADRVRAALGSSR